MKISKLKKKTVKELEKLDSQLEDMRSKMNMRFSKMQEVVYDAIGHVESLEIEKKSKKVKHIMERDKIVDLDALTKNKKVKKA